jgi:AcrR family transcriptional regulator
VIVATYVKARTSLTMTERSLQFRNPMSQLQADPGVVPASAEANGTRRRLLIAAVELFAARGFHGVSVRDIASSMGVQPSSLYAHYASKEDLFSELVFMANEEIRDRLRTALMSADPDPATQLVAIVDAYVEFHAEYPLLATIGHHDLHVLSADALRRVAALRKDAIDMLLAVITRGNESGVFHCAQPWLAVAAIAGMGIRLATWYRPGGHPPDPIEGYATEVRAWMPPFSVDDIREVFSDYALDIVKYRGASGR